MKKILAIVVLTMLLLSVCAPALAWTDYGPTCWDAEWYEGTMYVWGCNVSVTLRERPSTSARALMQIPKGAEIWCEPYSSQFAHVYYHGRWGYVLTQHIYDVTEGG